MMRAALLMITLIFICGAATAEEAVKAMKGMTVFGSSELPKGLAIVPWQVQLPDVAIDKLRFSVADEIFQPIERNVFLRQISYYNELFPATGVDR